jgi:L-lysine exporter family protein LysE/ArgO|tara:strand:- start:712 stop:1311 length:600 start_codon:yes stop_codon:yes gene_type:complete
VLAITTGFASGLALIIAIGAQNAFVLRQGLKRQNVFAIVLFCAVADAVLIGAGILGLGAVIESVPWVLVALRFGGAAYLVWFGISSIRRAISPGTLEASGQANSSFAKAIGTAAALTFLNPHVYIDTVILLGSIGNQFVDDRWWFWLGASIGSFVWFFGLGYFARLLAPFTSSLKFWRILDSLIALVMFFIAGYLLFGL